MMCSRISMSKVLTGRRNISDQLFQFFYFREASIILAIEYFFVSNCDVEVAIDLAWLQCHCFQVFSKSSQELLCHVGCPKQPPAFRTVLNNNGWFHMKNLIAEVR